MPKMSLSTLTAVLAAERQNAMGTLNSSTLTAERTKALNYYLGDMRKEMPAPANRSQATSSDVSDTIEGMMPYLMDIFASGEDVVRFEAVGPEDEEAAAQETDYVNHVFMSKNPGFMILYTLIKDALLSKVGVVKGYWEESEKQKKQTYYDQPEDVYAIIKSWPDIEITEHTAHPDPHDPTGQTMLHDIVTVTTEPYGCARVDNVPPEEFLISRQARSIKAATYCAHIPHVTEADLIAQGWDEDQVKELPTKPVTQRTEEVARNTVEDYQSRGDMMNRSGRLVDITEHYIRTDYDGSGRPQLYRVTTGGAGQETVILKKGRKEVIDDVEDVPPFAACTPIPMPHRFFGRSLADLVLDIQQIKTALLRALLDNAYLMNNQRMEISEDAMSERTLDDLLSNRPGGIVRTKTAGGLIPIPNQPLGNAIMPLIEYVDSTREFRTGVSKMGAGLGADVLQQQTAQAVNQAFTAAQARMKMVARILAETGIKDMFLMLHGLIRRHGSKAETVRLRNKWVTVDPRDWQERNDMTVNVGLGSGSKETQVQSLMAVLGIQKEGMAVGMAKPSNLYHTMSKMLPLMGYKDVESFFPEPEPNAPAPQPPEPPQVQVAKINAQVKQGELQQKAQLDTQKAQLDAQLQEVQSQRDAQLEAAQAQADITVNSIKAQQEMAIKAQEHAFKMEQLKEQHRVGIEAKTVSTAQDILHKEVGHRQSLQHKDRSNQQNLSASEQKAKQQQKMQLMATKLKTRKSGKKKD